VLFALDVTFAGDDGWAIVVITGELELATAPRLRQQVVNLVGEGHTRVVLDLTNVDFLDSIGLGVIVSVLKRVRSHGGELVLVGAVPRVRALFELTRLDEILELHDHLDDALAARPRRSSAGDG
jgi:anti-sigma B factor antagonist